MSGTSNESATVTTDSYDVRALARLPANPPCGGISLNSPRAGRQQGQVGSIGCVGGLSVSGVLPVGVPA